jgi:hypothetical protein
VFVAWPCAVPLRQTTIVPSSDAVANMPFQSWEPDPASGTAIDDTAPAWVRTACTSRTVSMSYTTMHPPSVPTTSRGPATPIAETRAESVHDAAAAAATAEALAAAAPQGSRGPSALNRAYSGPPAGDSGSPSYAGGGLWHGPDVASDGDWMLATPSGTAGLAPAPPTRRSLHLCGSLAPPRAAGDGASGVDIDGAPPKLRPIDG